MTSRLAGPASVPRVGVGCIVMHHGRVLLVRNRRGLWSAPGGHLDFGESPEDAAVRETREETGVAVAGVEFVALTSDVMPASGKHYITIWMRGATDDPDLLIADAEEIAEAGWFDPEALPGPRAVYFENLLSGRTLPPLSKDEVLRPEA
jgi:8-oxo-dGTP diphosphatase